jgi:hypothetical protein
LLLTTGPTLTPLLLVRRLSTLLTARPVKPVPLTALLALLVC